MERRFFTIALAAIFLPALAMAEDTGILSKFTPDLSLRARSEYVDWFQAPAAKVNDNYTFSHTKLQFGLKLPLEQVTFYTQGQYSQLYGLPVNGVGPGANFYGLTNTNTYEGDVILRQAYLQTKIPLGDTKLRGTFGRFLYANGNEVISTNKELESLKSKRIYNRVLGSFDFTLGRSFDGAQASFDFPRFATLSGGWMRPTQGGFDTDGSAQIEEINLGTVAVTSRLEDWPGTGELQLFSYYYKDSRLTALKADNRALDLRKVDGAPIELANFGAHWLQFYTPCEGLSVNTLLWGIGQYGDWGEIDHQAYALAAESAVAFTETTFKPETRFGWNYGSGDSNPNDSKHKTFYVMLPTVRQYALSPFFNTMNTHDIFAEQSLQISDSIKLQAGVHYLRLASAQDLLYAGAGANRSHDDFGIKGSPLSGKDIGALVDLTLVWNITKELSSQVYLAHLFGGNGIRDTYDDSGLSYGFFEMSLKI